MVEEEITIIKNPDGGLVAVATFGKISYAEALPIGFETWERDEIHAHLRRFVVPKLKTLIRKARMRLEEGEESPENLTEIDEARIAAAEAKRARKAAKLLTLKDQDDPDQYA